MTTGAKIFIALVVAMIIVAVGLVVNLSNQGKIIALSKTNQKLNQDGKDILQVVRAATGCKEGDTPKQCEDSIAELNVTEGDRRIRIITCIVYSIKNGSPEEAANEKCFKPPPKKEVENE